MSRLESLGYDDEESKLFGSDEEEPEDALRGGASNLLQEGHINPKLPVQARYKINLYV